LSKIVIYIPKGELSMFMSRNLDFDERNLELIKDRRISFGFKSNDGRLEKDGLDVPKDGWKLTLEQIEEVKA